MRVFDFKFRRLAVYLLLLGLVLFLIIGCKHPNETDSIIAVNDLCKGKYDYCIEDYKNNLFVFHASKWKITTGNKIRGFYYDEREQAQYSDGKIVSLTEIEMMPYDQLASYYVGIIKDIVEAHEYTAYSDDRIEYMNQYYYFTITEEGLARFEENFETGRIVFVYRNGTATVLFVQLFREKTERSSVQLTFGKIAHETALQH